MADRVAVLRRGRLQQVGAAQELYDDPTNLFVADFIGSPAMNLVAGRTVLDGDRVVFSVDGSTARFPLPAEPGAGKLSTGQPLIFGVRPEALTLVPDDVVGLAARVRLVESLGGEALIHVEVDVPPVITDEIEEIADDTDEGHPFLELAAKARFVIKVTGAASTRIGDRVTVAPRISSRVHLFDPATSLALFSANTDALQASTS